MQKPNQNENPEDLQSKFKQYLQKKKDLLKKKLKHNQKASTITRSPEFKAEMRKRIISRAKHYYGIPYSRKYHGPESEFYNYHQYLDCCGLVRQIMRDLQDDLGFTLGPWNQAYQFDMLGEPIPLEQMKPGDLVFLKAVYYPEKKLRPQKHDIVHVEIFVGGETGKATIGARWGKGVVKMFDSFEFVSTNYHSIQCVFKSIDPWLNGVCRSTCQEHDWNFILGRYC
jgi:cell wall-associated NlpC family hydrolase